MNSNVVLIIGRRRLVYATWLKRINARVCRLITFVEVGSHTFPVRRVPQQANHRPGERPPLCTIELSPSI